MLIRLRSLALRFNGIAKSSGSDHQQVPASTIRLFYFDRTHLATNSEVNHLGPIAIRPRPNGGEFHARPPLFDFDALFALLLPMMIVMQQAIPILRRALLVDFMLESRCLDSATKLAPKITTLGSEQR